MLTFAYHTGTVVRFLFLIYVFGCRAISSAGLSGTIGVTNKTTILRDSSFSISRIHAMDHYLPKDNNLKTKKLFRILGNAFDPEWMSIEEPEPSNDVTDHVVSLPPITHSSNTASDINRLNELLRTSTAAASFDNRTLSSVRSFMLQLSSCQTEYVWDDQGVLFWPRYIRSGVCVSGGSCSWPPGMACVPDDSKTILVLRWQCKRYKSSKKKGNCGKERGKNNKRKIDCRWKKIKYQVTEKCICTC